MNLDERPDNPDLALDWSESLVVEAVRLGMMIKDIAAESSKKSIVSKSRDLDAHVIHVMNHLRKMPTDSPAWACELRDRIDVGRRETVLQVLPTSAVDLCARVTRRSRALMVLVDVVLFHPWSRSIEWTGRAHRRHLTEAAGHLTALHKTDFDAVQDTFTDLLRQLRRNSVKFGARTEKVLQAVPGPLNAPVVTATTWLASIWVDEAVAHAIRDDLITELVIIDAEHDEEKAKRVVASIQERLATVAEKQRVITEELQRYRNAFHLLTAENRELRKQLIEERERARMAEVALGVALERICASPLALTAGHQSEVD